MDRHRRLVNSMRAFTLVEMVVVTAIILITASLLLPNLVAMTASRALRSQIAAVQRLPTEARNQAAKTQLPVDLRIDGDYIVMEKTDPQTQQPTEIKRVAVGSQLQPEAAQLQAVGVPTALLTQTAGSTDVASWKWCAYPDGTADTGGLTFAVGPKRTQESLYIDSDGDVRWMAGSLPQESDQAWTAGQIVQRTGASTSTAGGGMGGGGGAR